MIRLSFSNMSPTSWFTDLITCLVRNLGVGALAASIQGGGSHIKKHGICCWQSTRCRNFTSTQRRSFNSMRSFHLDPFLWLFSYACSSHPSTHTGYLKTVSHVWYQYTELACVRKSRRHWQDIDSDSGLAQLETLVCSALLRLVLHIVTYHRSRLLVEFLMIQK
jgi:hypothetical protein